VADLDASKLARFFTLMSKQEIEELEKTHHEAPHLRMLQKAIAEEVTIRVHGENALAAAIDASKILFGKASTEQLQKLDVQTFQDVFEGVPQAVISKSIFDQGISIIDALVAEGKFLSSNGEAKRELAANAISVNKEKVDASRVIGVADLISNRYVLLGKGKSNNYILVVQ
jgi:tyrosyl-tRNA synthetase